jgi:hypothetical protein
MGRERLHERQFGGASDVQVLCDLGGWFGHFLLSWIRQLFSSGYPARSDPNNARAPGRVFA